MPPSARRAGADGPVRGARRRRALAVSAGVVALVTLTAPGATHEGHLPAPAVMDFVPPPPGSYALHAIMRAPEGRVLDATGRGHRLSRFTSGKITLLSFMYTSCADARGCPLAYQVLHTVRHRVDERPELRDRVRLVSLSFDPARDTPARLRAYANGAPPNGVEWAFLTTESPRALLPLLDGFGQDVRLELDARGRPAGPLAHVLKVFLIDPAGVVREIYTTAYLFPEVVLNDIETLHLERARR
jgi:protein SCO1/2